jgi:hypothetical protein
MLRKPEFERNFVAMFADATQASALKQPGIAEAMRRIASDIRAIRNAAEAAAAHNDDAARNLCEGFLKRLGL